MGGGGGTFHGAALEKGRMRTKEEKKRKRQDKVDDILLVRYEGKTENVKRGSGRVSVCTCV